VAEGRYSFEIGKDGSVEVDGWEELVSWLEKERAHWDWLARGAETDLPNQWATNVQNQWDGILNDIRSYQNQNQELSVANGAMQPLGPGGQLLVSTSADGIQVLDIRASCGDVAGAFSYAFLKGAVEWSTVRRTDALLGVLLTALPDMRDAALIAVDLKQERKRFQDSLRSGMARLDDDFRDREASFDALVKRGKALALETLRRRKRAWEAQQATCGTQALAAVADINSVRDTFAEFMQLQAPVDYWTKKAGTHATAAGEASNRLIVYFIALTIVLGAAFIVAGNFLINHEPKASASSTAVYVVVTGGLAILSTVGFWIGRLFTKLYLSEHHLRTDADERAVMTKTYLALTNEKAATDAERQIILNAIFRSSADGIVKDEGPPDVGLQALLSKAMAR